MPDTKRRPITLLLFTAGLLAAALASGWLLTDTLLVGRGLTGHYYPNQEWQGLARAVSIDRQIDTHLINSRAHAFFSNAPFSVRWKGHLLTERPGQYRFALTSDDGSWLSVDGQLVVYNLHAPAAVESTVHLDAGLHGVELSYFDAGGGRALQLQWAFESEPFEDLSSDVLFPTRAAYLIHDAWLMSGYLVPLLWAMFFLALPLLWAVRRIGRHLRERRDEPMTNALLVLTLATATGLAVTGVTWGDGRGWAPDELLPFEIIDGLRLRFSNGWVGVYPPLHYYILGIVLLPFDLLARIGLTQLTSGENYTVMLVLVRLVSVSAAVGTVYLVYLIALELHGNRLAGILSALLVASMPPFVYYAKIANVDLPYIFWFTLSFFWYIRFVKTRRTAPLMALATTAALAVTTKDQAYGFYALPALHVLWIRYQTARTQTRSLWSDRALLVGLATFVVVFGLVHNLIFNFDGFLGHLRFIIGPASFSPAYERTLAGYLGMGRDVLWEFGWSLNWPSFVICVVGLAAWMRKTPSDWWIALPVVSYFVSFIFVVQYHYDRFFLGPCLVLALFGGRWLAERMTANAGARGWRVAGIGLVVYGLLYGSGINAAMVNDSRYAVERWAAGTLSRDDTVGLVGGYLPRFPHHKTVRLNEVWREVDAVGPDVVVINVPFSCRAQPGTEAHDFYTRLSDPSNQSYTMALSYRSEPWWPVIGPDSVFRSQCEHPFSNLAKVNPEIRIFRRATEAQP